MVVMAETRLDQVPQGEYVPDADGRVVLHNLDWARFEQLIDLRGLDRPRPRMAYLDGAVELMSPSHHHEGLNARLDLLLSIYFSELGIRFEPYGAWLLKRSAREAGAEPDACYLFDYDRATPIPERPDLVIEVVWTSGGLDKLEIYRRLEVPEVWFWRAGAITMHVLVAGQYQVADRSRFAPALDLRLMYRLLELPTNDAIRELRTTLAT